MGFQFEGGRIVPPDGGSKEAARVFHSAQREALLLKSADFVAEWESRLLGQFANGVEVDPSAIDPEIVPVDTTEEAALFRFAALHWSVPVSQGYGRRTRFLVRDRSNGKLIGIFALGDPVFNLGVRDRLIGWDGDQRQQRLYNVFDAFVMGAVEPYRQLIGGKLIALCAISTEVQRLLENKYRGAKTNILQLEKDSRPALITTTSSLGRSSVYNRISFESRKVYQSVGFTEGYGHFHFSDATFEALVGLIENEDDFRGSRYGEGPNWKMRSIRHGLSRLGLPTDLLKHGLKREVFLAPLGVGWRAFLRGETEVLAAFPYELGALAEYYRDRWAVGRAVRMPEFREWRREQMRLSAELEDLVESVD